MNVESGEIMPSGGIIMWSGSTGDIPEGWALCNGQEFTDANGVTRTPPNLKDKFIRGIIADVDPDKRNGGSDTVKIEVKHMPPHSHSGTTEKDGSHKHQINHVKGEQLSGSDSNYVLQDNAYFKPPFKETDTAGEHTHTFSTDKVGDGEALPVIPSFYALAFIMKK